MNRVAGCRGLSVVAISPAVPAKRGPVSAGLQDSFRQFADSTVTTMALQDGISLTFQGAAGITGCDQKPNAVAHCQVIEVVSQEC